jgi:hypothetical protein
VSGLVAAACFEFGMSSVCRWSLSWLLVGGWRCPHWRLTFMRPFGNWELVIGANMVWSAVTFGCDRPRTPPGCYACEMDAASRFGFMV